jgi:hypothetical protein
LLNVPVSKKQTPLITVVKEKYVQDKPDAIYGNATGIVGLGGKKYITL